MGLGNQAKEEDEAEEEAEEEASSLKPTVLLFEESRSGLCLP